MNINRRHGRSFSLLNHSLLYEGEYEGSLLDYVKADKIYRSSEQTKNCTRHYIQYV